MLGLLSALAMAAAPPFPVGTTLYVGAPGEVYDVTGGGMATNARLVADLERYVAGQVAFTVDRQLALIPIVNEGIVLAVTSDGNVSTFATGLSGPTGIWRTQDGAIVVAEFNAGEITDISAGGDFEDAVPANTGMFGPRCFAEAPDGTLYISDQVAGAIYIADLDGGPVVAFATGLGDANTLLPVRGLAWFDDSLLAAHQGRIVNVTPGGDQTHALPFGLGADFFSLAVTGDGRLVSGELTGDQLWDVSAGGQIDVSTPWAWQLPIGETTVGTVPADPEEPEDTGMVEDTGATDDTGSAPTNPTPTLPTDTGSPDTPATTEPEEGCGCSSGLGTLSPALLVVALAALRRRWT